MNINREGKIFDVVLLLILSVFIIMSFSFNETARVFPLAFGSISFIFILLNVLVSSMKNPPKYLSFIKQKGTLSGMSSPGEAPGEEKEEEISWKQILGVLGWLIAYIIALIMIYYLVATFLFLVLILAIAGKVPWIKSLLISIGFTGFLYFLFEIIL